MLDKKTYDEILNYLVKGKCPYFFISIIVECKRLENDNRNSV